MNLSPALSIIITAIPALLVAFSGVAKLSGMKPVVEGLTKAGVIQYITLLGIAEIVSAILFAIPATNVIGFLLLIGYFCGAIATDLSHGNKILPPVIILLIIVAAQLLAHPSMFF